MEQKHKIQTSVLKELDFLRLIAMLLVVLGHSVDIYTESIVFKAPIKSTFFSLLASYIYSFHVPLFIFISGAIYCFCKIERNKYDSITILIKEKFKRLMIPFLAIAIFYMIPIKKILGIQGDTNYFNDIINVFLGRNVGHLWFLFMLFDIFIIFYLYEKYILKYINSWAINAVIFIILNVLANKCTNLFLLNRAFQYSIYFYIGYVMFSRKDKLYTKLKKLSNKKLFLGITLLFLCSLALILANKIMFRQIIIIENILTIITAFVGIIMCYLIVYSAINRIKFKLLESKLITYINKESFNIYLLHEPLIFILLYFISGKYINPIIVVCLSFLVGIIGSLLLNIGYKLLLRKTKVQHISKEESINL